MENILCLETEKESHYSVMTGTFYNEVLAEFEEAKSPEKRALQYRQLKRFTVLKLCKTKKLISKSEYVKYYLSAEESSMSLKHLILL